MRSPRACSRKGSGNAIARSTSIGARWPWRGTTRLSSAKWPSCVRGWVAGTRRSRRSGRRPAALERLARGALTDSRLRATVHLRAGRIAIERLGDVERAQAHYARAVELDPRCGPALAALGRLHARRDDWTELARLHVAEAELA